MARGVLLDLSGVLYDGDTVLPGAVAAVLRLREAGLPVRFLTNTTRKPKRQIVAQLHQLGFDCAADEVFTPVAAARAWLDAHHHQPHLLVHPALEEDFADCQRNGPVAVVIGDAADRFSYDRLNATFRALMADAPLLALARNRFFRDRDGELSLDAGPFVEALEHASGVKARVLGKPSADFFRAAATSMGLEPGDVAMVGDDAESDTAGALAAGIGTAILVRTGKYRDGDEQRFQPAPSKTVADVSAACDLILPPHTG